MLTKSSEGEFLVCGFFGGVVVARGESSSNPGASGGLIPLVEAAALLPVFAL